MYNCVDFNKFTFFVRPWKMVRMHTVFLITDCFNSSNSIVLWSCTLHKHKFLFLTVFVSCWLRYWVLLYSQKCQNLKNIRTIYPSTVNYSSKEITFIWMKLRGFIYYLVWENDGGNRYCCGCLYYLTVMCFDIIYWNPMLEDHTARSMIRLIFIDQVFGS